MSDDVALLREALPAYEISEELGRGGWGVVYGGRHRHLDRMVAIKQLPVTFAADPTVRRRFASEARVLASLDHPHVVPVYDYLERDDLCLLVMEQLTGGTVRDRALAHGFTAQAATAVVLACAAGLSAAHARGVLHRDIKPENMLYTATGVVKVTDFGIAKVVGGADTAVTRAGDVLGTAAYIAPEQIRAATLSPATDVYGLATLLYELLAGRLPYPDDGDPMALMFKHAYEAPADLRTTAPDVPDPLAAVVMTGLATDPADRYAGAETFATALAGAGAAAWGPGWLSREDVPVLGAPAVLAAAATPTGQEPIRLRPPDRPAPAPRRSDPSVVGDPATETTMTTAAAPPPRPGAGAPTPPGPTPTGGFAAPPRPPLHLSYGPRRGPVARTATLSRLAVAAAVLGVLVAPVGLVLGIMARRRIARNAAAIDDPVRLTGRPAATTGIVLGALLTLVGVALAALLLVVVPNLPSSDLPAASVQSTIEKTVPLPAGSVRCPGPLPAQVGASITCTGTQNNAPVSLKATVSSVAGRDVTFDITRG